MGLRFLISEGDRQRIGQSELEIIAQVYGDYVTPAEVEVEVQLMEAAAMQALNQESRNINQPTDVLSFPLQEGITAIRSSNPDFPTLLGSIVICPSKASQYHESLAQLVHHGLLHICGFDHEQDLKEWKQIEGNILEKMKSHNLLLPGIPQ